MLLFSCGCFLNLHKHVPVFVNVLTIMSSCILCVNAFFPTKVCAHTRVYTCPCKCRSLCLGTAVSF